MSMYELLAGLTKAEINFVLVGGLAVTLHGYQRLTMDVDVALALDGTNVARFIEYAKSAKLRPLLPIDTDALLDAATIDRWHKEKGMQVFALRSEEAMATVMDVLLRPVVPFEELKRNSTVKHIGQLSVPIASIDDLIRLKTGTGRSKDAVDIDELRKIKQRVARGRNADA